MPRGTKKTREDEVPLQPQQVTVYVPERLREGGSYSNIANINVSNNEVVINFIFADKQGTSLVSKVILSKKHAQEFVKVFQKVLQSKQLEK